MPVIETAGEYHPKGDCPKCKGAGFVHPFNHLTQSPNFSEAKPCDAPCCLLDSIRAYKRGEVYMKEQGIEPTKTFDNFKVTGGCADARESWEATKAFADGSARFINLLLYGNVGCGKTHLCNAAARTLNERGIMVKLYTVADLLSLLRTAIDKGQAEDEVHALENQTCLILDDFKPEYESMWATSRLEEIIDYRHRNLHLTMVTTNRTLSELPERLVSRFADVDCGKIILNSAPDYRRRRK